MPYPGGMGILGIGMLGIGTLGIGTLGIGALMRRITRVRAQRGFDQLLDAYVATGANVTPQQQALGVRDQARSRSCACTPATAWLATLPTAPSLRLQSEEYLTSFSG